MVYIEVSVMLLLLLLLAEGGRAGGMTMNRGLAGGAQNRHHRGGETVTHLITEVEVGVGVLIDDVCCNRAKGYYLCTYLFKESDCVCDVMGGNLIKTYEDGEGPHIYNYTAFTSSGLQ